MKEVRVFTGNANAALAEEVCAYLKIPLGKSQLTRFSDGESYFQILENVRVTTAAHLRNSLFGGATLRLYLNYLTSN